MLNFYHFTLGLVSQLSKWLLNLKIFHLLESTEDTDVKTVLQKKIWTDINNEIHETYELKVTKWTVIKPFCQINFVIIAIILLLIFIWSISYAFYGKVHSNSSIEVKDQESPLTIPRTAY